MILFENYLIVISEHLPLSFYKCHRQLCFCLFVVFPGASKTSCFQKSSCGLHCISSATHKMLLLKLAYELIREKLFQHVPHKVVKQHDSMFFLKDMWQQASLGLTYKTMAPGMLSLKLEFVFCCFFSQYFTDYKRKTGTPNQIEKEPLPAQVSHAPSNSCGLGIDRTDTDTVFTLLSA